MHLAHSIRVSRTQFVEQGLGVLQIGSVEALGEPVVDFGEHRARLIAAVGVAQQPRKAPTSSKLPQPSVLASRDRDSGTEALLGLCGVRSVSHDQ